MKPTENAQIPTDQTSGDIPSLARVQNLDQVTATDHAGFKRDVSARSTVPSANILADIIGGMLGRIARFLDAAVVEQTLNLARKTGHYAVLAGAALTVVYAIYSAIKTNSFGAFLTGILMVIGIGVAQYAAQRFLRAAEDSITTTPSTVASASFLDCAGLLALLLAATTLVGGIVTSIQLSSGIPLLPAVLVAVLLTCFGAVALHPEVLNITVARAGAGEEAVGLLAFFCKSGIKIMPLFFCLLAVGGCVALLASFFESGQAIVNSVGAILQLVPGAGNVPSGLTASAVVLLAGLIPFFAYFAFVMQYLMLDVIRAILRVPEKLDALKK